MAKNSAIIGMRGQFVIPAPVRAKYGLDDGSIVIIEERDDGILLRPAVATPISKPLKKKRGRPRKTTEG